MRFLKKAHPLPGVFFIHFTIIIISVIFSFEAVIALDSHNLVGVIVDAETGIPVVNAEINLMVFGKSFNSDSRGRFLIPEIENGDYEVSISAEGYFEHNEFIKIKDGPDIEFVFRLNPRVIVMSGSKVSSKKYRWTSHSGTLIASKEISVVDAAENDDLSEIIKDFPGVFIRQGGQGNAKTISINGCDPQRVNIILDGILLNPGSGKVVDLSEIPLTAINLIELYSGRGGVGGTVSITTKSVHSQNNAFVDNNFGSFKSNRFKSGFDANYNHCGISCSIEKYFSNGDFKYLDNSGKTLNRRNNKNRSEGYYTKIMLPLSSSPEMTFHYYTTQKGSPGPLLQIDSTANIRSRKLLAGIRQTKNLSPDCSLKLGFNSYYLIDNYLSLDGFSKYDIETYESRYTAAAGISFNKDLSIDFETKYEYEDFKTDDLRGTSRNIDLKIRRRLTITSSSLSSMEISRDNLPIRINTNLSGTVCITNDYNPYYSYDGSVESVFDKHITSTLGLFGGHSFRYPDYYSLFFKEDIYALGNPDLIPEEGTFYGGRINISLPTYYPLSTGLSYTINNIDNIIVWKQRFDGKYLPDNLDKAELTTTSFNAAIGASNKPFYLKFQHDKYKPLNKSEFHLHKNKYLLFRPLYTAYLNVDFGSRNTRVLIDHRWIGRRYIRLENTVWLEAYQISSVSLKQRFSFRKIDFSIRFGIDNIGNEYYEIIERYPSPGRNYNAGINLII
ncbi:MAG: TonB-dependent receptor [candidate division Zixibacteria bacterium]|nr:TonB-dependent receptor [candidate division Zixibacteria bacterium]